MRIDLLKITVACVVIAVGALLVALIAALIEAFTS
jgi:energy-converting hydrogenase Eha subunit C